jgi:hypothetical protein
LSQVRPITQNFARPSYRPQETSGMDPEIRRMAVIAVTVGVALSVVVGALSFVGSRHHHGVPVIEAPAKAVRVKPDNPGGTQFVGAEDFAPPGAEKLGPMAEKPAIRALRAKRLERDAPHVAVVSPVKPVEPPVVAPAVPAPALVDQAPPPRPLPAVISPGGVSVQLAAFESEQAAEQDWGKMAEKMPSFFNGHRPDVQRAVLAGRTVYRLRTGGFANLSAANAFCGEVRMRGGDCSVAAF